RAGPCRLRAAVPPHRRHADLGRDRLHLLPHQEHHSRRHSSRRIRRGAGVHHHPDRLQGRGPITMIIPLLLAWFAIPPLADAQRQLTFDIYKQLVETNTTENSGNMTTAAEAMAKRLTDAGFPKDDVQLLAPEPRHGNLVARFRGTGKEKPLLLLAHLDVVEARREDWSTDPFTLVEKDGYY